MSRNERVFEIAHATGIIRAARFFSRRSLTVLNYHRVNEHPDKSGSDAFKPMISATPQGFARQMQYLARWFHVVGLRDVVAWLDGRCELPSHAALITFDDGYLDNYTIAFPILQKFNFPAVIFLTTGHIEQDTPFYWDLAAYCFYHTQLNEVRSPDGRVRRWCCGKELDQAVREWIESLKVLPNDEKQEWLARLREQLDVSVPHNHFRSLMMNWDQVREMSRQGIEFGAHTVSHPILTRVPLEQARKEIEQSKAEIEHKLGEPVLGFAYPNGGRNDFNPQIESLVAKAGFKTAFTLMRGPTSLRQAKRNPFAVRRIFLSYRDTLPRFAALSSTFNRCRRD